MESALAGNFLTEAELPKGMANTDGDCALGCRSASALQLDARILAGLVALSKDLGHDGSERLNVEPLQPASQLSSVERPPKSPRRSAPDTSMSTATSSAEAYDEGHGATQQGRAGTPSTGDLVEVLKSMLCGDAATPHRSNSSWKVMAPTTGLAVTVVDAVEGLYKELGVVKGKSLVCSSGPIDREEAYGYLMADAMGSALLDAEGARHVGERVRKRNQQHKAALPEAKKQAKREAKRNAQKAGRNAEEAATKAAADKELELLGTALELELPAPLPPPPPKPQPSRKRKQPEPEQRSEFDVHGPGIDEEQLAAYEAAIAAAADAAKAAQCASASCDAALAAADHAVAQHDACSTRCEDEEAKAWGKGLSTLSMAEARLLDTLNVQLERSEEKLRVATAAAEAAYDATIAAEQAKHNQREVALRMRAWFRCPDVVTPFPWPGAEYIVPCNWDDLDSFELSGYPPGTFAFKMRLFAHHMSMGTFREADEREDCTTLRQQAMCAMDAPPAPAPPAPATISMTTADIVRMATERPEACARVKAVIIRQDMSEEQKMAEVRSIVHGRACETV